MRKIQISRSDAVVIIFVLLLISLWAYSGLWKPFRVVISDSMEPNINKGDIVYVVKVRGELHTGDVVLYTRPDYPDPILHRIVGIETVTISGTPTECYIIKGDNNPVVDPPYPIGPGENIPCVPQKAIIGKEVFRIPDLGKLFFWEFD